MLRIAALGVAALLTAGGTVTGVAAATCHHDKGDKDKGHHSGGTSHKTTKGGNGNTNGGNNGLVVLDLLNGNLAGGNGNSGRDAGVGLSLAGLLGGTNNIHP